MRIEIRRILLSDYVIFYQKGGVGLDAVKSRYGIDRPQDMSDELYDRVMRALARTKSSDNAA